MHYKDENITRNIFMNLILAKELPFKLLIIKEACHALHIITLKKVMIAIYSQMMNEYLLRMISKLGITYYRSYYHM